MDLWPSFDLRAKFYGGPIYRPIVARHAKDEINPARHSRKVGQPWSEILQNLYTRYGPNRRSSADTDARPKNSGYYSANVCSIKCDYSAELRHKFGVTFATFHCVNLKSLYCSTATLKVLCSCANLRSVPVGPI